MKTAANFQFELTNRPFDFDEVLWDEQTFEVQYHKLIAYVQAFAMTPTVDSIKLVDDQNDTLVVKFHQLVHYDEVKSVMVNGKIDHVHTHTTEQRNFVGTISAFKFLSVVDTSEDAKHLVHGMMDELDCNHFKAGSTPRFSTEREFFCVLKKTDVQLFDSVGRLDVDPEIGDLDEIRVDD